MSEVNENKSAELREKDLIREIVDLRLKNGKVLKYEPIKDYLVPYKTKYSLVNMPVMTIKKREITFNMACIKMFSTVEYVLPMINENTCRIAIVPLAEEENASIRWARNKDGKMINRTLTLEDLLSDIYNLMGWDSNRKYKITGEITDSDRGLILVFDLNDVREYTGEIKEIIDEKTGKTKKREIYNCLNKYSGKIGRPYTEYEQERRLNHEIEIGTLAGYAPMVT